MLKTIFENGPDKVIIEFDKNELHIPPTISIPYALIFIFLGGHLTRFIENMCENSCISDAIIDADIIPVLSTRMSKAQKIKNNGERSTLTLPILKIIRY